MRKFNRRDKEDGEAMGNITGRIKPQERFYIERKECSQKEYETKLVKVAGDISWVNYINDGPNVATYHLERDND